MRNLVFWPGRMAETRVATIVSHNDRDSLVTGVFPTTSSPKSIGKRTFNFAGEALPVFKYAKEWQNESRQQCPNLVIFSVASVYSLTFALYLFIYLYCFLLHQMIMRSNLLQK